VTPERTVHSDMVEVTVEPLWRLKIRFTEGPTVTVRFDPGYFVGTFEPLRDPQLFNQASVDQGVIIWPGGIELTADAISDRIKHRGEWVLFSPRPGSLA